MNKINKHIKERLLWISVTSFLVFLLVALTFAPRIRAQSRSEETSKHLETFYDVFSYIQNYYVDADKTDTKSLVEGALRGMFQSLNDPYSVYLSQDDMRGLTDTTSGEFGGVGIYIQKTDKGIEVARPIEGTPAFQEGILAGDTIIAVEGKPIKDMEIDDVVKILRGKPGTKVTITVLRGEADTFDVTLTRAIIEIPTVRQAVIAKNIGYLQITQFTPKTRERVVAAIDTFKTAGYKSLIIDLRSNPGGLLDSVVNIVDLFFEPGQLIVSTRSRLPAENQTFLAKIDPIVAKDIKIVVLIDKYSASAAEILTGALKDTGRAYVIGETSYGKGSVQQILPIDIGGIKLTVSRYYTPSGISIDKIGIKPDLEVKPKEYTEAEQAAYTQLREKRLITNFVKKHPQASESDIKGFISYLKSIGIELDEELIRRDIWYETNRLNNTTPVYDLKFDKVLIEAVNYLSKSK